MRTVVFSDARVALAFNARFVCVWENQAPRTRFSDHPPKPEKLLYRSNEDLPLGTGGLNVISVFATPEGQILNAVPGYSSAETLFDEMRLALAVRKLAFESDFTLKPGSARSYAGLHRAAATLCGPGVPGFAHQSLSRQAMRDLGGDYGPDTSESRVEMIRRLVSAYPPREMCGG